MSRKWVVLCKDAHAVDFLSYYTFSPMAFFHLYFFAVDFLPFWLLVCWLFIIFDFFTIGFSPSLLFLPLTFPVSTFSFLTFYPIRLFHHWLFSISTFYPSTFRTFDFQLLTKCPFAYRPFTFYHSTFRPEPKGTIPPCSRLFSYRSCMSKGSARSTGHVGNFFPKNIASYATCKKSTLKVLKGLSGFRNCKEFTCFTTY